MTTVAHEPKPPVWPILPDSVDTLPSGARRCVRTGVRDRDPDGNYLDTVHRCMSPAVQGTTVCTKHGAEASHVRNKARIRMLELVDPAIATLAREMATAPKSGDRLRAAENVLDRAGFPRQASFDVVESKQLLVARLVAMRDARYAEEDELPEGDDILDVPSIDSTGSPVDDFGRSLAVDE